MGAETTSTTYRRTQTHESQSFSTKLLETKGTANKLLTHIYTCYIIPTMMMLLLSPSTGRQEKHHYDWYYVTHVSMCQEFLTIWRNLIENSTTK